MAGSTGPSLFSDAVGKQLKHVPSVSPQAGGHRLLSAAIESLGRQVTEMGSKTQPTATLLPQTLMFWEAVL